MKYKDIENYLDGEKKNYDGEKLRKDSKFSETVELFSMLENLPDASVPHNFERNIFKKLGISYMPIFHRTLILTGLFLLSFLVYMGGHMAIRFLTPRVTLTSISQFLSQISDKIGQVVSLIKVGQHLKYISLSIINPWFFVALIFVSMVMMMILILLSGGLVRKEMIDEVENI